MAFENYSLFTDSDFEYGPVPFDAAYLNDFSQIETYGPKEHSGGFSYASPMPYGMNISTRNTKPVSIKKKEGRFSPSYATKIKQLGWLYALYGALDGLTISYSLLKYFFDLIFTHTKKSSSDAMHDWMLTPLGITVVVVEGLAIVVSSICANIFDDKDKNLFKKYFVLIWPYVRDIVKVLKNSYKGLKSTIQVLNVLGNVSLNFLMLPLSVILGGLGVVQRIWIRHMRSRRKDMMKDNDKILADIEKIEGTLTAEICDAFRQRMKKNMQTRTDKWLGLVASAYGGAIDSLYLYVGIFTLVMPAWPALVVMSVFCALFTVASILGRMYEEYDYQKDLKVTHAKNELALFRKEHGELMYLRFHRLHEISIFLARGDRREILIKEQKMLAAELMSSITHFNQKHNYLQSLITLSNTSAFLAGLRNGLAAYSALTAVMFGLGTVLFLTSTAFPAALLIAGISLGIAMLAGFVVHSMVFHYMHRRKLAKDQSQSTERLSHIVDVLESVKDGQVEQSSQISEEYALHFLDDDVLHTPQFYFQEWFEVVRSFFSGLCKGKIVDYVLNPLQVPDEHGHYHDSPCMMGLTVASSLIYSVALAVFSFSKQFSRAPNNAKQPSETSVTKFGIFSKKRPVTQVEEQAPYLGISSAA